MLESKGQSGMFVVTFPLKTEKWQEDRINKILNMLTVLYNQKQKEILAKYIHTVHSPAFRVIREAGLKERREFWSSNGFTKYDIEKVFADASKSGSVSNQALLAHGMNSDIIQELSHRAWSAWEKKLYGQGKFIKLDNEVNVFKSRKHREVVTGFEYSLEDYTITFKATKPKKHNVFTLPFIVNRDSEYELFALGCDVRNIAIVRQEIRKRYKYYVQFSFAGVPYNKGRELGQGIVGIDPGPSKITYVSDTEVRKVTLAEGVERDERATRRLQRKLDRSRRATNPDKYNEDGTINRANKEPFIRSASYERTIKELSDAHRKLAAKRKIAHNILANELLTLGNEFHVENNSFKGMQSRAKESKQNAKGKNISKKRFGKSLANRAPSEFLTILKNKLLQYEGGRYVEIPASTACTQFDFTSGEFTKHELKERTVTTSDGKTHDRDAIAALNMKFVNRDKVEGKKKIDKDSKNFDTEAMNAFYDKFCVMEERM